MKQPRGNPPDKASEIEPRNRNQSSKSTFSNAPASHPSPKANTIMSHSQIINTITRQTLDPMQHPGMHVTKFDDEVLQTPCGEFDSHRLHLSGLVAPNLHLVYTYELVKFSKSGNPGGKQ